MSAGKQPPSAKQIGNIADQHSNLLQLMVIKANLVAREASTNPETGQFERAKQWR